MLHIVFIAPYPEIRNTINRVLACHPQRNQIIARVIDGAADELETIMIQPCDAVIVRGFSARWFESVHLDVPMVEIDISGYDVITSVEECRKRFGARKIAFIGFYNAFNGITRFSGLLGCEIKLYLSRDLDQLDDLLDQAAKDGCDAVIGGWSAHRLALDRGMNSVGLTSGEDSVGLAVDEAVRAIHLVRQERIKAETYRIITQSMKDGIIYVDAEGVIREDNRAARHLACSEIKGKALAEAFPAMAKRFERALGEGRESIGDLIQMGGVTVSVDYTPVVVRGQSAGVVISFQNITRVQQLEGRIRRKLHDKGLVAKYTFSDIVHSSQAITRTIALARRYAPLPSNVLITGETGTGKELFAQSIHNESARQDGPFVAVNCAALPENLLESELFGYVEGAFTGTAKGGKTGLFEMAHGGTLFLDEVSEIPVGVQSKLLRVLQEKEVRRIGAERVIAVDVRIISATNSNLDEMVANGLFRRDLLFRLNVFNLSIPPLRFRPEDVSALFTFFLLKNCRRNSLPVPTIQPEALELLGKHPLDGNVRELRNITARVSVLRDNPNLLTVRDMEVAIYPDAAYADRKTGTSPAPAASSGPHSARTSLRETALQALAACGGNRSQAAAMLGINRSTLWRRLRAHN